MPEADSPQKAANSGTYLWRRAREEGTAQVLEALWHEVQRDDAADEAE
jgi:hypothetical protein